MKSSGGPRNAPADRDTGDAGAGDAGTGGEPGAPTLRAMRAVWLTMRDEAPSDRGVTDLLAAARVKAEAMRPPPTPWQRLVAALRRPQVLALATALVLVGGAVVIGRRVVGERPGPHAVGTAGASFDGSAVARADPDGRRPEAAVRKEDPRAVRTGDVDIELPPVPVPPPSGAQAAAEDHGVRTVVRPGATETERRASGAGKKDRAVIGRAERRGPPPEASSDARGGSGAPGPSEPGLAETAPVIAAGRAAHETGDATASGPSHPRQRGEAPTAAAGAGTRRKVEAAPAAGATGPSDRDDAASPDREVTAEDSPSAAAEKPEAPAARARQLAGLYQQCESAARRGDCAEVRRVVGRITRTDRSYRARVAKDSAVAKCLAE